MSMFGDPGSSKPSNFIGDRRGNNASQILHQNVSQSYLPPHNDPARPLRITTGKPVMVECLDFCNEVSECIRFTEHPSHQPQMEGSEYFQPTKQAAAPQPVRASVASSTPRYVGTARNGYRISGVAHNGVPLRNSSAIDDTTHITNISSIPSTTNQGSIAQNLAGYTDTGNPPYVVVNETNPMSTSTRMMHTGPYSPSEKNLYTPYYEIPYYSYEHHPVPEGLQMGQASNYIYHSKPPPYDAFPVSSNQYPVQHNPVEMHIPPVFPQSIHSQAVIGNPPYVTEVPPVVPAEHYSVIPNLVNQRQNLIPNVFPDTNYAAPPLSGDSSMNLPRAYLQQPKQAGTSELNTPYYVDPKSGQLYMVYQPQPDNEKSVRFHNFDVNVGSAADLTMKNISERFLLPMLDSFIWLATLIGYETWNTACGLASCAINEFGENKFFVKKDSQGSKSET